MTPNRGIEKRTFGKEIDPDKVTGAAGRSLDGAMSRYETFQQKAPQQVVRVEHNAPSLLVPIGDCESTMYRSAKWYGDDDDEDYKHRHEPRENVQYKRGKGVIVYENAQFVSAKDKKEFGTCKMPRVAPHAWARLGYCLGFFVRRGDGEIYECNPRNTWLLSAPDGHMLAVYSPKPQSDGSVGFLCVMAGGKLRTLKEGIDG